MNQFFVAIAGFTVVNFVWQFVQPVPDWGTAIERSYFQAFAVGYCWLRS